MLLWCEVMHSTQHIVNLEYASYFHFETVGQSVQKFGLWDQTDPILTLALLSIARQ